jgi:hypothetical protein
MKQHRYLAPNGNMVSRQRIYQIRNAAEGLCIVCGEPEDTSGLCLKHAIYRREYARKAKGTTKRINSKTYRLQFAQSLGPKKRIDKH